MSKSSDVSTEEVQVIPMQIQQLDSRLQQIGRTVESIAESTLGVATKYFDSKAESDRIKIQKDDEQHKRETELKDRTHKRSVYILFLIVGVVFFLVLMAMYKEQYDLVKTILTSSFALAGGAGLASILKSSDK